MAIDLLVMPLSRYWSGDYVTSELRAAWARGQDAVIAHVDGSELRLPPGTPIGGPEAGAARKKLIEQVPQWLATLPYDIAQLGWDERAEGEVLDGFTHDCFALFSPFASSVLEHKPPIWERMLGVYGTAAHVVNARVFVDRAFEKPFKKGETAMGSLPTLEAELDRLEAALSTSRKANAATQEAAALIITAFREGLSRARALSLPLVVDV